MGLLHFAHDVMWTEEFQGNITKKSDAYNTLKGCIFLKKTQTISEKVKEC